MRSLDGDQVDLSGYTLTDDRPYPADGWAVVDCPTCRDTLPAVLNLARHEDDGHLIVVYRCVDCETWVALPVEYVSTADYERRWPEHAHGL